MYSYIQLREIIKTLGEILGYEVVINKEIDNDMFDLIWIKGDHKISFRIGTKYDRIKDEKFVGSVIKAVELGYTHIHIASAPDQIKGYESLCNLIDVSDLDYYNSGNLFKELIPKNKFVRSKTLVNKIMKRTGKDRSAAFKFIKQALTDGIIEKQKLGGYTEIYYRLK